MATRETRLLFEAALYRCQARELPIRLLFGHAHEAMMASDAVLVASGTATLEAALLNLVINARDAMPRGGTIRILSRRAWLQEQALTGNPEALPGPYVAIEVRDTGEGMAAEVSERAFEPFFTTKKDGQGTGLGLSQVFGFMRQIGGHVAIQSAPRN